MTAASAAVVTPSTFRLADRIKMQQEIIRSRQYTVIGRLTSLVFEGQRDTRGLSASRPRWHGDVGKNPPTGPLVSPPFSEKQMVLWASITLDWLTHANAPVLAISRDRQNLLLPQGMPPLPDIPDPLWVPKHANDKVPRIPQLLTGCPICGDRVRDKITARDRRVYGIVHPITEICVMLLGAGGTFGKIRGMVDPADGTHLSLLIDDNNPHRMEGYFASGSFQFGG